MLNSYYVYSRAAAELGRQRLSHAQTWRVAGSMNSIELSALRLDISHEFSIEFSTEFSVVVDGSSH